MTWEWVVLLSVLFLGSVFVYSRPTSESPTGAEDLAVLSAQVDKLHEEIGLISKVADENKKALSQQNLAKSLQGR